MLCGEDPRVLTHAPVAVGRKGGDELNPYDLDARWTFTGFRPHRTLAGVRLRLEWALAGTGFAASYQGQDISVARLWQLYVDQVVPRVSARHGLPADVVPVHWFVSGRSRDGREVVMETAPREERITRRSRAAAADDFLTYYTTPVGAGGEVIDWQRLPVANSLWRKGDPPGFVQEFLGWKPTVLRRCVDVRALAQWAGVYYPDRPEQPLAGTSVAGPVGGPVAEKVGWVAG